MYLMQFTAFQAHGSVCMAQQQLGRKKSTCHAENSGDAGSFSESGRSPGEGNGYPLQYSCLETSMDRGA